jgi:DnaK suppressor protein
MYNPRLFPFRQEYEMAAKKAATKKRKKASASKKKAASRKTRTKKVAAKKAVSRKKVSKKKVAKTKKKALPRKKAAKKKVSNKKTRVAKAPSKKKPSKRRKVAKKKAAGKRAKSDVLSGPLHGIHPYTPRRGEDYMSDAQLEHFRDILSAWKRELMFEVDRTVHHMQDEAANFPDPNDRATQESEFGLELRTRDRERKLLRKIDSALARIDEGSYGYCEETGEEIGLKRLEARPVATLCLEAQERRELAERQFRDRDDRYR